MIDLSRPLHAYDAKMRINVDRFANNGEKIKTLNERLMNSLLKI